MNDAQLWSWIVTIVGVIGWWFAGKKYWWAWYWGLGTQVLWTVYAIVSAQPAFFVSVLLYSAVYGKNAYSWTKEHLAKKAREENRRKQFKEMLDQWQSPTVVGKLQLFDGSDPVPQSFGNYYPSHSGAYYPRGESLKPLASMQFPDGEPIPTEEEYRQAEAYVRGDDITKYLGRG